VSRTLVVAALWLDLDKPGAGSAVIDALKGLKAEGTTAGVTTFAAPYVTPALQHRLNSLGLKDVACPD
jgi:hypothetical protein